MPDMPAVTNLTWSKTTNGCGWAINVPSYVGAQLVSRATAGKRVMEIGSAYGNVALPALRQGCTLWAVDPEPCHMQALIAGAVADGTSHRLSGFVGFFPAILEGVPDVPKFDMIFASRVFHCSSPETFNTYMSACYEMLAPGGTLMLETTAMDDGFYRSLQSLFAERRNAGDQYPGYIEDSAKLMPEHTGCLPPEILLLEVDDLMKFAENAGFSIERCHKFSQNFFNVGSMDTMSMIGLNANKPGGLHRGTQPAAS